MIKAVISGDIVSSTSLRNDDRAIIEAALEKLLNELKQGFNIYGRIIKGDYLECVIPEPQNALRVALAIKSFVKAIPIKYNKSNRRVKLFIKHGIRLAIGYGRLSRFDPDRGIIDGEAIYLSGRTISKSSTYSKERTVIKNTLYFVSKDPILNNEFDPLLGLLDVLIAKATPRQCEVLYLKLMNYNEGAIAAKLKIKQPVVNQHSKSVGWNAIENAVNYFSEVIKNR